MNRKFDAERLAAFVDGRLDDAGRAEVIARLGESADDSSLLADVAAVNEEIALANPDQTRGRSFTNRFGMRGRHWVLAAAALAGIAVVPLVFSDNDSFFAARLARLATSESGATVPPPMTWESRRGAPDLLSSRARAMRAGALLVDLEIARALDAHDRIRGIAGELAAIMDSVDAPLAAEYRALSAATMPAAADTLSRLARFTGTRDDHIWDRDAHAGAWLRAAMLAAEKNNESFFHDEASLEAMREVVSRFDLPAELRDTLQDQYSRASSGHFLPSEATETFRDALNFLGR